MRLVTKFKEDSALFFSSSSGRSFRASTIRLCFRKSVLYSSRNCIPVVACPHCGHFQVPSSFSPCPMECPAQRTAYSRLRCSYRVDLSLLTLVEADLNKAGPGEPETKPLAGSGIGKQAPVARPPSPCSAALEGAYAAYGMISNSAAPLRVARILSTRASTASSIK